MADLREEKSLLDSRQKDLADLQLKEKDKAGKEGQLERIMVKNFHLLQAIFGSRVPEGSKLKDAFIRERDRVMARRQAVTEELAR